jgi:hypothetical protein
MDPGADLQSSCGSEGKGGAGGDVQPVGHQAGELFHLSWRNSVVVVIIVFVVIIVVLFVGDFFVFDGGVAIIVLGCGV